MSFVPSVAASSECAPSQHLPPGGASRSAAVPTLVIPYALWTGSGLPVEWPSKGELTNLRQWLCQVQRTQVRHALPAGDLPASLSMPHEQAWAAALGWQMPDGCLPWAAIAAEAHHLSADTSAWCFVTLCNWHVRNGQVTMGDPAQVAIDAQTDAQLFHAMQDFFAQDGIVLHPYLPGHWLAQSDVFANLPTASLDRVMGRNMDPWLVGSDSPTGAASLLRRLQNEMQMLLYTHPVNADRPISINSVWWHGAGALPAGATQGATRNWQATVPHLELLPSSVSPSGFNTSALPALRTAALQQDGMAWMQAWRTLDQTLFAELCAMSQEGLAPQVVFAGELEWHVYDARPATVWGKWLSRLGSTDVLSPLFRSALREQLVVQATAQDV